MQNLTVQKLVLAGVFFAGCAAAVFFATQIAEGNHKTIFFLVATILGLAVLLLAKDHFWLAIPIGLSLNLPAIPIGFRTLEAPELAIILATLLFFIRIALQNQAVKLRPQWSWPIILYLFMVGLSFANRPVGLWVLGSETGGARFYIKIGMAFMAFLILASIEPKEREIKWILGATLIGQILTAFWNAVSTYYLPAFAWLRTTATFGEEGFYTWHQNLSVAALPIYTLTLASLPYKKLFNLKNCFWSIPVLLLCVILVALSGKRAGLAMCLIFPVIIGIARKEYFHMSVMTAVGLVAVFVMVAGQGSAFTLPLTVQRTMVNLPGKWDERVIGQTKGDAFSSEPDKFRKLMHEKAREIITENPWTGQGLGVDLKDMVALISGAQGIDEKERQALAAGSSWHAKWLGMAADIGIPASIFYAIFNLMMLALYMILADQTRGMGWINAFVLVHLCYIVRWLLLSTTGGHTAISPFEEWWIYGLGLSLWAALPSIKAQHAREFVVAEPKGSGTLPLPLPAQTAASLQTYAQQDSA